jgi:hypothetical protein
VVKQPAHCHVMKLCGVVPCCQLAQQSS